jgi:hypothetical protein
MTELDAHELEAHGSTSIDFVKTTAGHLPQMSRRARKNPAHFRATRRIANSNATNTNSTSE